MEWLRDSIRRDVATGFYDEDAILTHAIDSFQDEFEPDELRREAQRLLRIALTEQEEAQRNWPARTDCVGWTMPLRRWRQTASSPASISPVAGPAAQARYGARSTRRRRTEGRHGAMPSIMCRTRNPRRRAMGSF